MRVAYDTMYQEFVRVLKTRGFTQEKAERSAKLYADASCDGIYTHGLNRFPKFISFVDRGLIRVDAEPELVESSGFFERYDGNCGPGNLNAYTCMERAIQLAGEHTIGCVALRNTNHWMRAGNYGLMATDADCIGVLWTNTLPNMPPWGGRDARLGNNPVVFAVPNGDTPVLVDVATSMFSYGKLESYARAGKELPVDGGLNKDQKITRNAAEILETHQAIPIGYWKGSGLSLALDLIAATLSGGNTTEKVGKFPAEIKISQVFIAISLKKLGNREELVKNIRDTLADMKTSTPVTEGVPVHYPGEHMKQVREENRKLGIPVDEEIWNKVLQL